MKDNNVTQLVQPGEFEDPLSEIVRNGARSMLAQAIEIEAEQFLSAHAHLTTDDGYQRLVRHGHLPERQIQTGIGSVTVKKPRVRDRCGSPDDRIKYTSTILPSYIRRSKSLDELIPALYLRGISTGDFQEVLSALLGPDAPNLSHETIRRLKATWKQEWEKWRKRDLSMKHYVLEGVE